MKLSRTLFSLTALSLALFLTAGCNSTVDGFAPVSGRLTVDGQPVAGLQLMFKPRGEEGNAVSGTPSFGVTDSDGSYRLRTRANQPGVFPGPQFVVVSMMEDYAGPYIPASNNKLEFIVPEGGTDSADFDVESGPIPTDEDDLY
ncbi:MAG: hypothetical protein AAF532_15440 [Planctomycetota bacterium]